MKRPLLVAGLLMVLVIALMWSRHDSVVPPNHEAAPTKLLARAESTATVSASQILPTSSRKREVGPRPVTDSYLSIFDSRDIRSAVDNVLHSGSADQKGWAATLAQDCSAVLTEDFAKNAKSSGDAALESFSDLSTRCAGFKDLPPSKLKAVRDKLRTEAKESSSDYAKLHALSDRADAGDTRWSTVDQAFIARGLYSGDPVLEYAALEVVISCIDRNIVGADDRTLALRMVQSQIVEGRRGQVTELMFCASGVMCNASNATLPDSTTPDMLRLERAYQSALDSKTDPSQLLAIR